MVELSDPKGPVQEGIDNSIFIVPGIIVVSLISKSICGGHVESRSKVSILSLEINSLLFLQKTT